MNIFQMPLNLDDMYPILDPDLFFYIFSCPTPNPGLRYISKYGKLKYKELIQAFDNLPKKPL